MKATIKIKKEIDVKYLEIDANIRYWEDADVNGVDEQEDNPTIPFSDKVTGRWNLIVDVDSGSIVDWPTGTTASVHYKVCDEGVYTLKDKDMQPILTVESYVPDCLAISDSGYGDYMCLDIDENGKIVDWSFDEDDVESIIKGDFKYEED